jgi:hypothetical protein
MRATYFEEAVYRTTSSCGYTGEKCVSSGICEGRCLPLVLSLSRPCCASAALDSTNAFRCQNQPLHSLATCHCDSTANHLHSLELLLLCRRCWDEYVRFKNCMIGKINPDQQIAVLPGPHFLWHIRTRKQAAEFWTQHYAHLGAGATSHHQQQQQQQPTQQQPNVDEPKLRADVTSRV